MNRPHPQRTAFVPGLIRAGFDWSGTTGRLPYVLVTVLAIGLASLIPATRNFSGANTAVFVALTMIFPIWLGHTRRRLRDVGWSGWFMWVAILPVVGLILTILLAFKPGGNLDVPADGGYSRLGFAVSLTFGCLLLSRAFWAPYWIPAGSMKPTLMVGDFVAVVPVSAPERGDLLVFRPEGADAEYIKRLIGLPGDTVQMQDGRVILNGTPLPQGPARAHTEAFAPQGGLKILPRCTNTPSTRDDTCRKARMSETLPDGRSYDVLDVKPHASDNTGRLTVPAGRYYVLGDHRDNSADSRRGLDAGGLGLIPSENITGRVALVLFSSAGTSLLQAWTWRADRFFLGVE